LSGGTAIIQVFRTKIQSLVERPINVHENTVKTHEFSGVLTRDAIARYKYGSREFNSVFFQNNYVYPLCFVPRPMDLIQHPCNTGFQYFENMFLNITAASTATVAVNVYAVWWAILQLMKDSQLSVDN